MSGQPVARYQAQFEQFATNGASADPAWLRDLRHTAIARFGAVGFPTTREERWRFTNVDAITKAEFAPSVRVAVDAGATAALAFGDPTSRLVAVFVNGRFQPAAASLAGLPSGVTVGSLTDAFTTHGDLIRERLGKHADLEASPFTALNAAFIHDGAFVHVPRDVELAAPLQLVFLAKADRAVVSHPRTLVIAERGARMSIVETYAGPDGVAYWTNAVTEVVVGENAAVDAYRVQREGDGAYHTATSQSYQGRNSVYASNAFAFGSALSRHDIGAVLDGEGAEATLNGLSVLDGRQHVDHHTTIDHAKPHCNSWELFNGIYDDRSRGVFTGRIIVRPGAQKTDSKQTNNNLLLTEHARADSQPQLEIYADDVRCTHGATLGPIDPKAMFYLRSRGLDPDRARALLTYGFGAEILNAVAIDDLRDQLDGLIHGNLESRG
ncbi:MAG TPA: Fe-S cluster assembly protein SufD [Gemmatimonadales bacterium]